jgi:hypothetical protein
VTKTITRSRLPHLGLLFSLALALSLPSAALPQSTQNPHPQQNAQKTMKSYQKYQKKQAKKTAKSMAQAEKRQKKLHPEIH